MYRWPGSGVYVNWRRILPERMVTARFPHVIGENRPCLRISTVLLRFNPRRAHSLGARSILRLIDADWPQLEVKEHSSIRGGRPNESPNTEVLSAAMARSMFASAPIAELSHVTTGMESVLDGILKPCATE